MLESNPDEIDVVKADTVMNTVTTGKVITLTCATMLVTVAMLVVKEACVTHPVVLDRKVAETVETVVESTVINEYEVTVVALEYVVIEVVAVCWTCMFPEAVESRAARLTRTSRASIKCPFLNIFLMAVTASSSCVLQWNIVSVESSAYSGGLRPNSTRTLDHFFLGGNPR